MTACAAAAVGGPIGVAVLGAIRLGRAGVTRPQALLTGTRLTREGCKALRVAHVGRDRKRHRVAAPHQLGVDEHVALV